uniref:Uncharacterized protein n=1 Tax=Timema tahoe TaxID=61484 RepID=A0A7R9IR38_9NEOP|nr:unnamed protein product [Timema tahoe]
MERETFSVKIEPEEDMEYNLHHEATLEIKRTTTYGPRARSGPLILKLARKLAGEPTRKSGSRQSQTWSDLKVEAKKKAGIINDATRRTGGGPPPDENLTEIQKRIVGLLGQVAIEGIESALEVGLVNNIQDMAEPATPPNVDPFAYGLIFEDEVETELVAAETESVPLPKRKYSNEGHSSGKRARLPKVQQVEALVEVEEKKTLALEKIGDNLGKIADNLGKIASVLGRFLNK